MKKKRQATEIEDETGEQSLIFSLLLRALSACIAAAKWTRATKEVHRKTSGREVLRSALSSVPCRHLLQKDFTLD